MNTIPYGVEKGKIVYSPKLTRIARVALSVRYGVGENDMVVGRKNGKTVCGFGRNAQFKTIQVSAANIMDVFEELDRTYTNEGEAELLIFDNKGIQRHPKHLPLTSAEIKYFCGHTEELLDTKKLLKLYEKRAANSETSRTY